MPWSLRQQRQSEWNTRLTRSTEACLYQVADGLRILRCTRPPRVELCNRQGNNAGTPEENTENSLCVAQRNAFTRHMSEIGRGEVVSIQHVDIKMHHDAIGVLLESGKCVFSRKGRILRDCVARIPE